MLQVQSAFITFATHDWETLVQFYQKLLSQDPSPSMPNQYAEFQIQGLRVGIFKPKPEHQTEFARQTQTGISLCLEVEDLDAAIAHLTKLGYPPPGEITTASHGREIYAYDPAGNRLILYQRSGSKSGTC